ncbi:MAG: SH3 domain-containing protein, partial [Chloroflexota bacterium]
ILQSCIVIEIPETEPAASAAGLQTQTEEVASETLIQQGEQTNQSTSEEAIETVTPTIIPTETHTPTAESTATAEATATNTLEPTATHTTVPTNTPRPTSTATSTPTPEPVCNVTRSSINVREGLGTHFAAVDFTEQGESLAVLAFDPTSTWFLVQLSSGRKGWAAESVCAGNRELSKFDPPATLPPTYTLTPSPTPTNTPTSTPTITPTPRPVDTTRPILAEIWIEELRVPNSCVQRKFRITALAQDHSGIQSVVLWMTPLEWRDNTLSVEHGAIPYHLYQIERIDPTGRQPSNGRYEFILELPVWTTYTAGDPTHYTADLWLIAADGNANAIDVRVGQSALRINLCTYLD